MEEENQKRRETIEDAKFLIEKAYTLKEELKT